MSKDLMANSFNKSDVGVYPASVVGKSKDAILMLHGFPAYGSKNEDLAKMISKEVGKDIYLLTYKGLTSKNGPFSFVDAIEESITIKNKIAKMGYQNIDLLGHSWGGFVALNIVSHSKNNLGRVTLISPMVIIPDESEVSDTLDYFLNEEEKMKRPQSTKEDLLVDLDNLKKKYSLDEFMMTEEDDLGRISIFQAGEDVVTPQSVTEMFLGDKALKLNKYEVVKADHWFSDRKEGLVKSIVNDYKPRKKGICGGLLNAFFR